MKMMFRFALLAVALTPLSALGLSAADFYADEGASSNTTIGADCTCKGIPLKGRVKVVTSFADFKVQVVTSHADLKVKVVESFPDECGKWQFVESFPDFTIQYVESFPDFKVKLVTAFPGVE